MWWLIIGSIVIADIILNIARVLAKKKIGESLEQLDKYLYIIKLEKPSTFYDISIPPLIKEVTLDEGFYELICISAMDKTDTFWWQISGRQIGISPLGLKGLIDINQAIWIKKPPTSNT